MFKCTLAAIIRAIVSIAWMLMLAALLPVPRALAQSTVSGTLAGDVCKKPRKGAPCQGIPGAKVTIINVENSNKRAVRTNKLGRYTQPSLPSGTYTLMAEKEGYRTRIIKRFPVQFGLKNEVRPPEFNLSQVTLHGKVVDRDNNILRAARVVATNASAGIIREAVTDQRGDYLLEDLPTGHYLITASWRGDSGTSAASLPIELDDDDVYASTIKLADAISPDPIPAQQTDPPEERDDGDKVAGLNRPKEVSRTSNFAEQQLHGLPLGGASVTRSFDELALLVPGVAPPPFTPGVRGPGVGFGVGTAGQFSVNGMRARSNNFSVDGSDNNDADVGVRRQGFVALVPQVIESVQEISVSTLLWDAELGRNLGSQVNAVSKYGSNNFHGQAYSFFSDSRLNARSAFDYEGGASGGKDPFTRTQSGFAFGGPMARDRTHFFGSFEHDSLRASTEQHFATPTLAERSFNGGDPFKVFGSDLTFRNTTPVGRNVLSFYPAPNHPGGPFGNNTYTEVLPADGDGSILSFRVTHQVTPNNTINARYNYTNDERVIPSVNRAIRSTLGSNTQSHNFSLIFDSALGTKLFNQARVSFGRTTLEFSEYPGSPLVFSAQSAPVNIGENVTVAPQTGAIGELLIAPYSAVGVDVFTFPQQRASNTFQYADTLSWTPGNHVIKFGGNLRRYQLNSVQDRLYRPLVTYTGAFGGPVAVQTTNPAAPPFVGPLDFDPLFSGVQQASLGVPSSILQTITLGPPDSTIGLRFTEYHGFINDNWRIRSNLTLDLGVRYEYNTVPREVNERVERALRLATLLPPAESRFNTPARAAKLAAAVDAYKQILSGRRQIYDADANNFGPHLGFAWSPGESGKTTVRAGYGIYFDTILGSVVSQSRNVFPTEISINVDPSFLQFDGFVLNNPSFLKIVRDAAGNFTNPVSLLKPGACNQFGTCNQLGGTPADFVPLIGQLFSQNLGGGLAFTLTEKQLRTPYAQHWHLTIERELFGDYLLSAAYVGTTGTKLTRLTTPNLGPNVIPVIPLAAAINDQPLDVPVVFPPLVGSALASRPNKNLGAYQIFRNSASSNYHALQLEARTRYGRGYQLTASYTWSHAIDDVSDVLPIAGAPLLPQDSSDLRSERGSASFDVRHRVTASVVWELPFYRNQDQGLARWLGGWQVASIFEANSGQPFTLLLPFDANLDGNLTDRPLNLPGLIYFSGHGSQRVALAPGIDVRNSLAPFVFPTFTFPIADPGGFVAPPAGGGGGAATVFPLGRNTVRGDGLMDLHLALHKSFKLGKREGQSLAFRAEFFNVINRTNYGLPIGVLGAPGFGTATETATPARTIQLALKYSF